MSAPIVITFPAPADVWLINARMHWRAEGALKRAWRATAVANAARQELGTGVTFVGGHPILPTGGQVGLPTDGHSTAVSDR